MASYYVYSGAGGGGTGANWANAFTTMTLALSGKAAGDIFYIAHDHLETTAGTLTLTSPGTLAAPCFFYCVDRAGSVPPVGTDIRTTGEIRTTGTSSHLLLAGAWFVDGLVLACANSGATNNCNFTMGSTANTSSRFRNCTLKNLTTAVCSFAVGTATIGADIEFENTTFQFGGVTGNIALTIPMVWKNTPSALQGAVFPTNLFQLNTRSGSIIARGVDLSAMGSGKTIIDVTINTTTNARCLFDRCKIDDDATKFDTPASPGNIQVDFIRCSESAADGGRNEVIRARYEGTLTTEYTIVWTGGATDGITPVAWKIVTTANTLWARPFEAPPIVVWNSTDGSAVTVTLEGIWGGGAVPTNKDIWIEVEYLGSNTSPQGSLATSGVANNLTAASNLNAGSGTWGGSTTKFKLECTFTPQQRGPLNIIVKAGKVSDTFYVDPKPVLS